MILVFDENIPPKVAEALQALGSCEAQHITRSKPRGTADEEVFEFVASRGAILVTQDAKIRRRPHQLEALKQAGIGAFILSGRASRSVNEMMVFILQVLADMQEYTEKTEPPFVFGISDKRKFERLA